MVRTRVRRRLVAAAFVMGLLVAGCSDADGEPAPTGEPTATETADESPSSPEPNSPAPGPTPWPEPTRPAAMERDDIEGAKAAAEYFLALYPYVFATGDLEDWVAMSDAECQFCEGAVRRVTELHADGGYGTGGEFTVEETLAEQRDQAFLVGLSGVEAPSEEYAPGGGVVRSLPGGRAQYIFELVWRGEYWVVTGGSVEAVEE